MPRRRVPEKRSLQADCVYGSAVITRLVNQIMVEGKKSLAESIVYGAMDIVKSKSKAEPLQVFEKAIDNIRPVVELKSRRVGGATYQVPVEVQPVRAITLAIRWLVEFAGKRGEKGIMRRLAAEILDAADEDSSAGGAGKGGAVKKRTETHRMAEANRAFASCRWN